MIRFTATTPDDLPQIQEWIAADLDHAGRMAAEWWLGGNVLNCCAEDKGGPVLYVRLDREGENVRMHIQFAPTSQVSKLRTAAAILEGFPRMASTMKNMKLGGIIFESTSEPLIKFMSRPEMGFVHKEGNDYVRV